MTEAEWLTSKNPAPMLISMLGTASERKLRLFGVACCRRCLDHFKDPRELQAVLAAEKLADGAISETEREGVQEDLYDLRDTRYDRSGGVPELMLCLPCVVLAFEFTTADAASVAREVVEIASLTARNRQAFADPLLDEQIQFVHDIFGNPFRPAAFDPRWCTADVTALARAIYDDRAFDRLPILADALMDAGCGDKQVLGHCRGPGPHVRGCWVVDLVLGKE
ncbi:MAG TPA: hypothetical protein VKD90_00745 [Gemmataceae bacterium]|nr:hypothetical protein [Gemmataceae bacterium]